MIGLKSRLIAMGTGVIVFAVVVLFWGWYQNRLGQEQARAQAELEQSKSKEETYEAFWSARIGRSNSDVVDRLQSRTF